MDFEIVTKSGSSTPPTQLVRQSMPKLDLEIEDVKASELESVRNKSVGHSCLEGSKR